MLVFAGHKAYSMDPPNRNINDVPNDIKIYIIENLNDINLVNFSCTNHYWRAYWKQLLEEMEKTGKIFILGRYNSGKRTFVHVLCQKQLYSPKSLGARELMAIDEIPNINIVRGGIAGTSLITPAFDIRNKRMIVDCSGEGEGLCDPRALQKTMKQKLKLILLVQESFLEPGCIQDFAGLINDLTKMSADQEALKRSVAIFISQPNWFHLLKDKVRDNIKWTKWTWLKEEFNDLTPEEITTEALDLMNFLIDNQRIGFFYSPEKEGPYIPSHELESLIESIDFLNNANTP